MSVVRQIAFPDIVWVYLKRVMKEGNLNTSVVTVKAVMHALGLKDTYGTWRWEKDYPPIRDKIVAELEDQVGELADSSDSTFVQVTETTRAAQHGSGDWFGICDECGWTVAKLSSLEEVRPYLENHECM